MADTTNSDAKTIVDTAIASVFPHLIDPDQRYTVVVPDGGTLEVVDLDGKRDAPRRTKGTYTVSNVDSFIALAKGQASDATTVWVNEAARTVTAVINDATSAAPAWADHRVVLALALTPEWEHWTRGDGNLMDQQAFAEHIEDGLSEIREPDAATMLEIAQSFHASTNAEFRSAQRLSNGQVQVQYDEEIKASAGQKGELEVPQKILLGIAPFVGEEPYAVDARLRYRLGGGKLRLGYKLDHPERALRDAIELIAEKLRGEFDRVYVGKPA